MKHEFKVGDIFYHKASPHNKFKIIRVEPDRYVSNMTESPHRIDPREELITRIHPEHDMVLCPMYKKKQEFNKELEKILSSTIERKVTNE